MRQIIYILILAFTVSCNGQTKVESLDKLDLSDIQKATISLGPKTEMDDSGEKLRSIPFEHIYLLVDSWNTPEKVELRKYLPAYSIDIYLKNGTVRSFRLSGSYVKEKNDYSAKINHPNLGNKIWKLSYKY